MISNWIGIAILFESKGSWLRESGILRTALGKGLVGFYTFIMLFGTSAFIRRTEVEDEALREKFPVEWDAWAAQVPCKLLPEFFDTSLPLFPEHTYFLIDLEVRY